MLDFKNIPSDAVVIGNIMKVEEAEKYVVDFGHVIMKDGIPIGGNYIGHIKPGRVCLEEVDTLLLRYNESHFIRLRDFNPYIGPFLLRSGIVNKNNPNNGVILSSSASQVRTGNCFVDSCSIRPYNQLEEGSYSIRKLRGEVRKLKSK